MSQNEKLYDLALSLLRQLFSDTSVEREQTISNLLTLQAEIDIMLDSLK